MTIIDYYPVIFKPITEYSTVQECLRHAEQATIEVGQHYVFSTFDLGVCMKAYPLLWNFPQRFDRHIVLIGTFHLNMAYLKMIGKKMEGSGLSDILVECNLISPGSIQGVVTGKHFNRSTYCHKVMYESLNRLLIEEFLKNKSEDLLSDLRSIVIDCPEQIKELMSNDTVCDQVEEFLQFCQSVREGALGKTAQFWLSYMDHISLVLALNRSVKTNNFLLYSYCIGAMPDLFFSYGGQNYSRYLTFYSMFIANLEFTHPGAVDQIKLGIFSVARSMIPGSRCAVDKTMEETFMRHAKSKAAGAGISGIAQNHSGYQRWARTTHERCQYKEETFSQAGLTDTEDMTHKDLRPSLVKKSESHVKECIEAIGEFMNPFTVEDAMSLYNISTGVKIPPDIEDDIMNAEAKGLHEKNMFVEERLECNSKFFDPVKKLKLKTMATTNKTAKLKSNQNKLIELKQQGNIAFQLLLKSQEIGKKIDIGEVRIICVIEQFKTFYYYSGDDISVNTCSLLSWQS